MCWGSSFRFLALLIFLISLIYLIGPSLSDLASKVNDQKHSLAKDRRYILYDVNFGEGFNLRRDVYLRVANLVRGLRARGHNFILVLPPWGRIYHWQSPGEQLGPQYRLPWSRFFDLISLNRFVPVLEFDQYLAEIGGQSPQIDTVFYLQHYKEGWSGGEWEEKWHQRSCIEPSEYEPAEGTSPKGPWRGWFFGYPEVRAQHFECISIQGYSNTLISVIEQLAPEAESVMFDRAETILHDHFGDVNYWNARKSMRFAKRLREIADDFRQSALNSTDESDVTVLPDDWTTVSHDSNSIGGPYLSVHWRRKDFLRAHGKELPSIEGTAAQVSKLLEKLKLDTVFLCTDAPYSEVEQLRRLLEPYILKQFLPSADILMEVKDGGVAIIDQWIAAHARHFVGSYSSTFSYRIQDEREIMGFKTSSTFNRLCPDSNADCEQPAKWTIKSAFA